MINGRDERIPVTSEPSGAVVTVECGNAPLYGGLTPTTVTLPRSAEQCALTIGKEGYGETRVELERRVSRAAVANKVPGVVTGVVFGLFAAFFTMDNADLIGDATEGAYGVGEALGSAPGDAVDRRTGAKYKHVPGTVYVKLEPEPKT